MTAVLLMVMKNRDKQNTSKPNHHPKMACKTAGLRRQCEVWVCIAAAQRGANKPSFSIGSTWKREDFPGFGVDMHWNCGCFYTISIYIPKIHSRICENISSARWKMMEQLGNIETACTDFIRFLCMPVPLLPNESSVRVLIEVVFVVKSVCRNPPVVWGR